MNRLDFVQNPVLKQTAISASIIALAIITGLLINLALFFVVERRARKTKDHLDDLIVKYGKPPGRFLLASLSLSIVAPALHLSPTARELYTHTVTLFSIGAGTHLALNMTALLREAFMVGVNSTNGTSLVARKIVTEVRVVEKALTVLIVVSSLVFMLMTFESIRQAWIGILVSTGLAGTIVGIAAQRSLGAAFAGIQIAMTQPIRVGDEVVVEGESGTIEEITLTYVVVKTWDLRRLVVPTTHFIDKPCQNWTRVSTELLGAVFLYTDYGIPVDAVRTELERIVGESSLWNGNVCNVLVTNTTHREIELRCTVSAADASKLWDLRCLVREKLVAYLQAQHPSSLPHIRAEIGGLGATQEASVRRGPPSLPAASSAVTTRLARKRRE